MKKKTLTIVGIILFILIIIGIIASNFIKNIKEDKKITKQNIEIIETNYEKLKKEVENYNNSRRKIATFINNFYYDTIENNYQNNLDLLEKHDDIVETITEKINILDKKCNTLYNDPKIDNICNNYKKDYEIIVNVFINDLNNYNNKLITYNKDNNKELLLFKSENAIDYIDYNKDKIYEKKDEVND